MDRHQSKIIIGLSVVISLVVVFFAFRGQNTPSGTFSTPPPIPNAKASQMSTSSVGSPDGKFSLTMKQVKSTDTTTFSFIMTGESSGSQNQIFSDTLPNGSSFLIPLNTFSSDDKYVFLKQTDLSKFNYFVLTASGTPISKNAQTIDFSGLFKDKYSDLVITEAIGWAGPTLIVINTNKSDGSLGPSFWYDVASNSFIQLSERFN